MTLNVPFFNTKKASDHSNSQLQGHCTIMCGENVENTIKIIESIIKRSYFGFWNKSHLN